MKNTKAVVPTCLECDAVLFDLAQIFAGQFIQRADLRLRLDGMDLAGQEAVARGIARAAGSRRRPRGPSDAGATIAGRFPTSESVGAWP